MRHAIWAIAGALAVMICANPANAAITGATISTSQPSYSGSCPTTIPFKGTITGTAGTVFTYTFNRFIDSVQHLSSSVTMTMPSGGSYSVSDSYSIPSSTSARTFDQIWVHNISGGQSDVYSNEADFSVTCGVPPPPPSRIPAPTKLSNTVKPATCGQHGGLAGLFCPGALSTGYLVLVWDYKTKSEANIDGYHVYEVSKDHNDRVYTQDNAQATLAFLKPTKGGFSRRCYEVTAFKGTTESKRSDEFCVPKDYEYSGPPGVVHTLTLHPTGMTCKQLILRVPGSVSTYPGCTFYGGYILMGFNHIKNCCTDLYGTAPYITNVWRTALAYDPSSIRGLNVFKATLLLKHPKAKNTGQWIDETRAHEGYECYGGLGMVTAPWPNNHTNYFADDFSKYPTHPHFNVDSAEGSPSIDVTEIVRAWASGKASNYGFVFREPTPNQSAHPSYCYQFFDARPVLSIEAY